MGCLRPGAVDTTRLFESRLVPERIPLLGAFRTICATYVLYVVLFSVTAASLSQDYLIYATYWNALMTLAYFLTVAFATLRHLVGQDPLVGVNMFAYVLIQTVIPISLTVVVLYWAILNPYGTFDNQIDKVNSIQNHATLTFLIVVDLILNNVVFVLGHIVFPIGVFLVYLPVNAAWSLTMYPVYSVMTWKSVGTITIVVAALVAIVFFFILCWLLTSRFRSVPPAQPVDPRDVAAMIDQEERAAYP
ncbi:THH1/TOM1/TOM3 domain-containing protein [Plasmodiophora brassicae]